MNNNRKQQLGLYDHTARNIRRPDETSPIPAFLVMATISLAIGAIIYYLCKP